VVEQLGNPFLATSQELVALDTQDVMEQAVATSLSQIRETGQALHAAYTMERLEKASTPVSDTITRNNLLTFANRPDHKKKGQKDSGIQRQNMTLITQLFLSLQSRHDADMTDFFRFENQREQTSLADRGRCDLGRSPTFFNASMHPLAVQLLPNKPWSWCWIWRQ